MRTLLFLVLLAGCGRQTIDLVVDPVLLPAALSLEEALNKDVDPPLIRIVEPGTGPAIHVVFDIDEPCGRFNIYQSQISISHCGPTGRDQLYAAVLAHEVGHVLGLEHSDDKSSIMFDQMLKLWKTTDVVDSLQKELRIRKQVILPPKE